MSNFYISTPPSPSSSPKRSFLSEMFLPQPQPQPQHSHLIAPKPRPLFACRVPENMEPMLGEATEELKSILIHCGKNFSPRQERDKRRQQHLNLFYADRDKDLTSPPLRSHNPIPRNSTFLFQ